MFFDRFQNKYRISSSRAVWHDYNGGVYFITVVTDKRKTYFGEIVEVPRRDIPNPQRTAAVETPYCGVFPYSEPQMQLSEIGLIADDCIRKMESLHNDITVPLYQIMPNHIHLIVQVDSSITDVKKSGMEMPQYDDGKETPQCDVSTSFVRNRKMQSIANQCGRLSCVVSGFKAAVTRLAHENHIQFAWQSRFYDHIVYNQNDLNNIAKYIETNVSKWHLDELNEME